MLVFKELPSILTNNYQQYYSENITILFLNHHSVILVELVCFVIFILNQRDFKSAWDLQIFCGYLVAFTAFLHIQYLRKTKPKKKKLRQSFKR